MPLRASDPGAAPALSRRPWSLAAKAAALRAPLQSLSELGAGGSQALPERASRAGRLISDIVSDDETPGSSSAESFSPGPAARPEDGLRDAVADLPAAGMDSAALAAGARFAAKAGGPDRAAAAGSPSAFAQALDAADTFGAGAQALGGGGRAARARWSQAAPAQAPAFDLSLLILKAADRTLRLTRAAEAWLLSGRAPASGASRADGLPLLEPGPAALPAAPVYALGPRGPEAGARAVASGRDDDASIQGAAPGSETLQSPDPSVLPRGVPQGVLFGLLLPLLGVALFYLRELRR